MIAEKQQSEVATTIWQKRPIIIAGPCSAETEEQVIETTTALAQSGKVDIFRFGIWKPRTKPGNFEGIGTKGLPWLNKVKDLTGIPCMTEVATAKHVEDALTFGLDALWIGARTTVNPFSVQEIADALRGVDVPVFIKNPINPDIELWIGAIERIEKAGIKNIGLIHRGFSSAAIKDLRNAPMWHIPIEMKRRFPNLPLICDPSHICGIRPPLADISQHSINLDFDGLIVESHRAPDDAWSDAKQQLTPSDFIKMLDGLVWKTEKVESVESAKKLERLRAEIDHIDDELINLLSARMKVAEGIGTLKKEMNVTILQPSRWNDVVLRLIKKGEKLNLSKEFVEKFLESIHLESINHQNKIIEK